MNVSHRSRIRERITMARPAPCEGLRAEPILVPDHIAENPPFRRSERETGRLLAILDELETGEDVP